MSHNISNCETCCLFPSRRLLLLLWIVTAEMNDASLYLPTSLPGKSTKVQLLVPIEECERSKITCALHTDTSCTNHTLSYLSLSGVAQVIFGWIERRMNPRDVLEDDVHRYRRILCTVCGDTATTMTNNIVHRCSDGIFEVQGRQIEPVCDDMACYAKSVRIQSRYQTKFQKYICAYCGNKCQPVGVKKFCSACDRVCYCSKECQMSHWKQHKRVCKAIQNGKQKEKEEKNGQHRFDEKWGKLMMDTLKR